MADESSPEYLDGYSIQIARLVIASSYLEHRLNELLQSALALNDLQTNALVNPMSSRNKIELLERLNREHIKGKLYAHWDLKGFCQKAKKQFAMRNEIVHGEFGHDKDRKISIKAYTGKNKLTGAPQRWPGERLSELATDFMSSVEEADGFLQRTRELAQEALVRKAERS
ncbi:MAG: hypothetical protein APF82_10965 [Sphingomonadales bacterium BRH_c42]|nr:MAG: hypothetical protein APF82_10965 [Sphingomonadales bacterium BRH_c42]